MPTCEGTIPETRISKPVEREVEQTVQTALGPQQVTMTVTAVETEVIPSHPCDAPATVLARSMEQQTCNLGELHWVTTEDHVYCAQHFEPGQLTHHDGRVTQHAPMSVEDA